MRYFSTFTGIGGFELGIKQAYEHLDNRGITGTSALEERRDKSLLNNSNGDGWRTNPMCVGYSELDKYAVQIYQKHFPEHKNYGDITKINADTLPDFDLLVGGFPCQAFSIAGKRKGFDDTRGTLFFDLARILKAKKPRYFIFENVKGLLSHDNGNTFKTIISTIDELGYDCQWQVLNSKNFGVPQNRERVFIVGHLRGTGRLQVFPLGADSKQDIVLPTLTARYYGAQANGGYISDKPKQIIGGSQGNRVYDPAGTSVTLASQAGGLGAKTGLYMQEMKIRRLTPTECERLQGFPDGWTEGVSDTQRYKTLGNAVTVNVVQAIINKLCNP